MSGFNMMNGGSVGLLGHAPPTQSLQDQDERFPHGADNRGNMPESPVVMPGNMPGNMPGMPPMGFGPMMPAMGMPPSDPNMMMGYDQYGQYMQPGMGMVSQQEAPKEPIKFKDCALHPPPPNARKPSTRDRPPGCRTIFIGGLPDNCTEDILRQIFENCGSICSVRISKGKEKKNFAHIRFDYEWSVEKALFVSGYTLKFGEDEEDKGNQGRIHVDYAQARDDLYEWECQQRILQRNYRHQMQEAERHLRPPSPPPVSHFTDHDAHVLMEKLKDKETFFEATQLLVAWLNQGDCSKRNATTFYSMVQSTNSHVRNLMNERAQYDQELENMKFQHKQRLEALINQFEQIDKVFACACKQKAWDHFSKAQRKNIELWRKQAEEIKKLQQSEFLKDRHEDEMEMSDAEDTPIVTQPSAAKKPKMEQDITAASQQWLQLREENENLRCQVEAYKNEVELMKMEKTYTSATNSASLELSQDVEQFRKKAEDKDKQIQVLQQTLKGMQQQLINLREQHEKQMKDLTLEKTRLEQRERVSAERLKQQQEKEGRSEQKQADTGEQPAEGATSTDPDKEDQEPASKEEEEDSANVAVKQVDKPASTTLPPIQIISSIDQREARLIGVISTFLHVHPFGASANYIWSYLQRLNVSIRSSEIEDLLEKLPSLFQQNLQGVGASLEKLWVYRGFEIS